MIAYLLMGPNNKIDIDAMTGDLTVNNNDNLTSVDLTGSEIGNVTFTNNDLLVL